ncbi:MAG: tRNA (cytidine(34)-2'-O)-methyltransferase [Neisseriaceae bacterium]|nr:tRNA (cytidine(34)-2'-O)-methyltransferase [Neisseriaceae bacterium]
MFNVVLYQPEIPPNTGNVIRLCANTGVSLHLVKPLGFPLDSAKMRRAGLDYHEIAAINVYETWTDCLSALHGKRFFYITTKGKTRFDTPKFQAGDVFVFGPETRGLPVELLGTLDEDVKLRIPMLPKNRSMNLSNTVAIVVFEAWRQNGFSGGL